MLAEIPASMFWEWWAYYKTEPFDEQRADIRHAHLVKHLHAATYRGKTSKTFKAEDYMLKFGKQHLPELDLEQQAQRWQALPGGVNPDEQED